VSDGGQPIEESETKAVYRRFRQVFGDGPARARAGGTRAGAGSLRGQASSVPFGEGRDPHELGSVMDALTTKLGWNSPLARSELLSSWQEIVGQDTAEHSAPSGIDNGVLTVICDSTAWATQLRLMRAQIATQIATRFPDAGIETVRFEGPNAPSWKRGPRSIPGRGPRDTYG
jgi:predicted nucleic acid-binding Zn ribbon protein